MISERQFSPKQNKNIAKVKDALGRLKADPTNAILIMALYEACTGELQEIARRYFGKDKSAKRAVFNLLAVLAARVSSYDSNSINALEWVSKVADAEANRLVGKRTNASSRGKSPATSIPSHRSPCITVFHRRDSLLISPHWDEYSNLLVPGGQIRPGCPRRLESSCSRTSVRFSSNSFICSALLLGISITTP
jgi:hypothetical protein